MKGRTDQDVASLEAKQEAGVAGSLHPKPIGYYRYWKRVSRAFVPVKVAVYALEVQTELADWKESRQRKRAWLSRDQASSLIDEPELLSLVLEFSPPQRGAK